MNKQTKSHHKRKTLRILNLGMSASCNDRFALREYAAGTHWKASWLQPTAADIQPVS